VRRISLYFGVLVAILFASSQNVHALPFNDDMVDVQLRAGSSMRPKSPNSVPLGSLADRLDSKEEAKNWENPLKGDAISTENGRVLFSSNCAACHGDISKTPYEPGLVGKKLILKQPPDISTGDYKNRTDGDLYSTIYLGFGLMPRVGYKLSSTEKWDIVNYIRKVQSTK